MPTWTAQSLMEPVTGEFYDLREDPGEQHDLAAAQPDLATAIRETTTAWLEECRARVGAVAPEQGELTPEQLERLRTIGYVK